MQLDLLSSGPQKSTLYTDKQTDLKIYMVAFVYIYTHCNIDVACVPLTWDTIFILLLLPLLLPLFPHPFSLHFYFYSPLGLIPKYTYYTLCGPALQQQQQDRQHSAAAAFS